MIKELRQYLLTCPYFFIEEGMNVSKIKVDYLSDKPTTYSLNVIPETLILKQYVDGGALKQKSFILQSIETYSQSDIDNNINNLDFFDEFEKWLEENKPNKSHFRKYLTDKGKTEAEIIKFLEENKNINELIDIKATTGGYINNISDSLDRAVYQIQCSLTYMN